MLKITSTISWINGFSALALVCSAFIYGLYFLYNYKKTKNTLYLNGAVLGFACTFGWMGITISFLSVLFSGDNAVGLNRVIPFFSYSTIPLGSIAVLSIAWTMLMPPKYKKHVLIAVGIFSIIYYIILYATFTTAVVCPPVPKGEVLDDWLSPKGIPYYLVYALVLGITVIFAIGILRFFKAVTGELRKRAIWIILSTPIIGSVILLDTVVITGPMYQDLLYIVRFLMIPAFIFTYIGFKPAEEL